MATKGLVTTKGRAAAAATKKATTKKAARGSPAGRARRAGVPPVPLSQAAAKRALAEETRSLRVLCEGAGREAWQIGRRLTQIAELGLHRAAGFSAIDVYAEHELALSRTKTFQYMRVADAFTEAMVGAYGMDKLEGALAYFRATPEEDGPADVPRLRVRVPDAEGRVHAKPFADVTVRELAAARRHEAEEHEPPHVKPEILEHAAAVTRGLKAMRAAVARSNRAAVALSLASHDGLVTIEVHGVPFVDGPKALHALADALESSK